MKRGVQVLAVILGLVVLAIVGVSFFVSANSFRPELQNRLSAALGRPVTVGDLKLSILSGGVTANDLSIAEDPAFGGAPFLHAGALKISVDLYPLIFSKQLNIRGLTIEEPQVALLQSPSGEWNYSTLGGKPDRSPTPPPAPPADGSAAQSLAMRADLVQIKGGQFSIGRTGGTQKPLALKNVNLEVRNFSAAAAFPFSLSADVSGGGHIELQGTAGPMDQSNAELTPVALSWKVTQLNLATALAGTVTGMAGMVSLEGQGTSRAGEMNLQGKVQADGLKAVRNGNPSGRPVQFDFALTNDLRKHAGQLRQGTLHIGAATANLSGTYAEQNAATVLNMKFAGAKMPIPDLEAALPAFGVILPSGSKLEGGTASLDFTVTGPADRSTAAGTASLDDTRLTGFDLGGKMGGAIQSLTGIKSGPNTDIQTLGANIRMTPEGIVIDNLRLIAPSIGDLAGAGTISPANALDFKMTASVKTSGVAAALSGVPVSFFVQGTAQNPVFKPDVQDLARRQAQKLLQSDQAQKFLKGNAGKAASGILGRFLGGGQTQNQMPSQPQKE